MISKTEIFVQEQMKYKIGELYQMDFANPPCDTKLEFTGIEGKFFVFRHPVAGWTVHINAIQLRFGEKVNIFRRNAMKNVFLSARADC